ncbi:hypothetical protein GBA52_009282, partial [Prunus armeniaca]
VTFLSQPCLIIRHLHLSLLPTASPNKPSNSTMRPPSNSIDLRKEEGHHQN